MPTPAQPACPKCGYDQTGEIATWQTQCPTRGVCSECGLEFAWTHTMRPELAQLSWYVEHAKNIRAFLRRSLTTFPRVFLPHRFWAQLDPTKPVSITRLVLWAILFLFAVHTIAAVPNGYNAWIQYNWNGVPFPQYHQMYGNYAIAEMIFDGYGFPYFNAHPRPSSHNWSLQITQGWPGAWFEFLINPITLSIGILLLWSLVLLAVPQTRRLAKLRKRHVARAMIISLVMIAFSYELTHLIRTMYELRWLSRGAFRALDDLPRLLCWVWLLLFWGCAIHTGWLIRPSRLLITLGTTAAVLGGITLSVYVFLMHTT